MPHTSRIARALAGVLAATAVVGVAACGPNADPNADIENGKKLFSGTCGGCHILADAKSPGTAGPDLDDSFRASRQDGFKESEFEANILRWINDAPQKPARVAPFGVEDPVVTPMPAGLLAGQDAQDVAAYVARVAGKDKESAVVAAAAAPPPSGAPAPGAPAASTRLAADETALAYDRAEITAPAGAVTLEMDNPSEIPHNVAIRKGDEVLGEGEVVGKGEVSTVTADLVPGEYEFYCSVPGHAEGGMVGTLVVTDGGGAPEPAPAEPTPAADPDVVVDPPVDGVQTVPLPENPTGQTKGSRIVGPWASVFLRDRRISQLKATVAARSYPVDRYVKPGYWIQINPE